MQEHSKPLLAERVSVRIVTLGDLVVGENFVLAAEVGDKDNAELWTCTGHGFGRSLRTGQERAFVRGDQVARVSLVHVSYQYIDAELDPRVAKLVPREPDVVPHDITHLPTDPEEE